jgi:hypothetical protein
MAVVKYASVTMNAQSATSATRRSRAAASGGRNVSSNNYDAAVASRAGACAASHSSASGEKNVSFAFLYSRVG